MSAEILVEVTGRDFCAGAVYRDDQCIIAAPILRRHLFGRSYEQGRLFAVRRNWRWRIILNWQQQSEEKPHERYRVC